MKIVAITGSLRAGSGNVVALRAAAAIAPPSMEILVYEGIGGLPHFNPDLDYEGAVAPPPVAELRALLDGASGVLVSSPEYAHGVPGTLKNALDWLVSTDVLGGKPVVLLNVSASGGEHAQAALAETLRTMGANVLGQLALGKRGGAELEAALRPWLERLQAAAK
jgi:chromate reductase